LVVAAADLLMATILFFLPSHQSAEVRAGIILLILDRLVVLVVAAQVIMATLLAAEVAPPVKATMVAVLDSEAAILGAAAVVAVELGA